MDVGIAIASYWPISTTQLIAAMSTEANIEKEIYEKTLLVGEAFVAGDLDGADRILAEIARLRSLSSSASASTLAASAIASAGDSVLAASAIASAVDSVHDESAAMTLLTEESVNDSIGNDNDSDCVGKSNDGDSVHEDESAAITTLTEHKDESAAITTLTEKSVLGEFRTLDLIVKGVFERRNMKLSNLARKTASSFSREAAVKAFGSGQYQPSTNKKSHPFPRRGNYYCTFKSGDGKACPFHVPFSWFDKHNGYLIKPAKGASLCLMHNHPPTGNGLDGCAYITSEVDLISDEIDAIHTLSLSQSAMGSVKEALAVKFPKRDYSSVMVIELYWTTL